MNPELYRELFLKSCDGKLVLKGRALVECNEAALRMLGYPDKNALLGRHPADLSPTFQPDGESSLEKAEKMIAKAEKTGSARFEWLHKKADGSDIWMEVTLNDITVGDENVCYATWRDIHLQKEAEANLKVEQERLALALEATGFEIWENDFVSGKVTQPDRIYKTAGYEPGEVPTNFDDVKALIHPDDIDRAFEAISRHLEGKTANYSAEFRFKKKDGGWMWLANFGRVYEKNAEGVPLRFIGLTLDITRKKETELALEKLNRELEKRVILETAKRMDQEKLIAQQAKMALMGEMIGIITHQWKQPLSVLSILSDDLQESYAFGELDNAYLDEYHLKVSKQLDFMGQTIDSFRTFLLPSKERKPFRVTEAVKETVGLLERMFRSKGIHIGLDIGPGMNDQILGFENEFKQVIVNILANAKDAYESSGKCPDKRVDVAISNEDGMVNVLLRDYAGGIDISVIGKLFDQYVTTKGDKGSGIGLNISKTIIERMDGELTATNHDAGGALFAIRLPLARV